MSSYASFSWLLLLLFRLFCSRLGGGVGAKDGGFLFPSSFLCLSMSSLCEPTRSCCLNRTVQSRHSDWERNHRTCFWLQLSTHLMRFWKAYPSVHCSVKEAPCRTVVKWPRRRRSCMLLSLHAIFSCLAWTRGDQKWIAENKQWLLCALKTHLFDKELLAHGHTLAEPLLVALQHLLLLIHLSPQITVSLPTAVNI